MLQKDFAPYEPSLDMKELGFDEPCLAFWDAYNGDSHLFFKLRIDYHWLLKLFGKKPEPVLEISNGEIEYLEGDGAILAPTFSQAFRWFREMYQLHNGIYPYYDEYEFQIKDFRLPTSAPINGGLMPYEEAELACLIKLIQIVKEKK